MHAVTEEMGSERKYLGRRKCEHHRRLMFPVQSPDQPTGRR
jgi:hypothetical protein